MPSPKSIYFVGIGGTGMAAIAGLCKARGCDVVGSDKPIYPPMSDLLKELAIPTLSPYARANIEQHPADVYVIGNALSRGNAEVEAILEKGLRYTSFPALLNEFFLREKRSIVIAGTHGKTTTTSLLAHCFQELGQHPSFFVGGIPLNFKRSFQLGTGKDFIIEGDEYDTAFFDKGPKFMHYNPEVLVLNNIEFDHADIYPSLEAIDKQFVRLLALVKNPKNIFANVDDVGVRRVLKSAQLEERVTRVSCLGQNLSSAAFGVKSISNIGLGSKVTLVSGKQCDEVDSRLWGEHNGANLSQCFAVLVTLLGRDRIAEIIRALGSFLGVKRRLEHLGTFAGIDLYEDFAHHPTAVAAVLSALRSRFPQRRIFVAFEPANATNRRNVHGEELAEVLKPADQVLIGPAPQDQRIPENERMNTSDLKKKVGDHATAFATNEELGETAARKLQAGDLMVFMSSSSFSGVQHRLGSMLQKRS